ncbi:hypothetical protein PFLCHA0_c09660 [Pseudomonas protegens CHA0]|uniref:Uncharacterized protein n=1 Tax=Pseudomonas protegens (strain DSM 19095 / LMG 27888 / CFBP 6595 / CHA0) TaxID=1124983 RepID=A0A2C9EGM9_PSEPH|nr:hypothetical protein PFLCHA0_c09660 [Pseudomonas protegens CHA0]
MIRRQAGSYHTSRDIRAYRRSWLASEKSPQDRIRRQARCLQAQGLPSLV